MLFLVFFQYFYHVILHNFSNMSDLFNPDEINNLINGAFSGQPTELRQRFDKTLEYLDISFNQARENLGLTYRALNGILDGNLEQVDMMALIKISQFLELEHSEVARIYADTLTMKHRDMIDESERRTFILNNFDLAALKANGIIDSIRDFNLIEYQLKEFLGLDKILDFQSDETGIAYWISNKEPKDTKARRLFMGRSKSILKLIGNPFEYRKDALIEYFPKIRWQSLDLDNGLITVMQHLYKIGITVLFLPKNIGLKLRGATCAINGKPCIVLTDYRGYYPTLWYALLHELFHVIFDWEDIKKDKFHLSLEDEGIPRENEANDFARDYFLPPSKIDFAFEKIDDRAYVKRFALDSKIHPSLIYARYAFVKTTKEENVWKKFNAQRLFPKFSPLLSAISVDSDKKVKPISYAAHYTLNIYNY